MRRRYFAYPYSIWMVIFIVVPMLLVLYYSFTDGSGAFTLENFQKFFQPMYLNILWRSLWLAFISTALCLLIGYPAALALASKDLSRAKAFSVLFIVPMWMNFLLRTYAWVVLLERTGIINSWLTALGLPIQTLLYTDGAIILGMVYNFLPFMILPIYSVLRKMDRSYIEAAEDLGANGLTVFRKITLPMSVPGVISGITMVFMPAASTFVISRLLGGSKTMLIGDLIENQFLLTGDMNFGSALSVALMLFILLSMAIMNAFDKNKKTTGGLW